VAVTPNNTVLGRYRIVREIARSNDIVYEALDPQMSRRVALKELQLPQHLAGAQKRERIERFYREAKAAGTLSHPNVVTVFEVGQENDRHFIAMEFLEGQSLRDILQMQGALPLRETLDITLQLCEALGYAHAHGVVHRDVKPDNIHILPGGVIKLTDFGIARLTAEPSITSQGQVFGTPSYMSPEQVASQNVDQRTDLFSLGITLYEMLTGRKPFTGDSVITITYNIMNMQPVMPIGIPPMLQGILQKVLAKDPNLRYQSAAALAADLRAQKFELDTPAFQKTGQMTFGHMPATPSSPTPSYMGVGGPALGSNSHMPGQPSTPGVWNQANPTQIEHGQTGDYLPYTPRDSGLSPQARSFLGVIASVFGFIVLIFLLIWGVSAAYRAYQADAKQRAAFAIEHSAQTALGAGNLGAAATEFQQAQQAAPPGSAASQQATQGMAAVQVARGQQYQRANDPTDAETAYQQALATDSHNAEADDNMGRLLASQNNAEGAAQYYEAAIQSDPTSPFATDARTQVDQIYQQLAQQAQQNNNIAQARDYWQKIVAIDAGSPAANQAQAEIDASNPVPTSSSSP
jgi:serine/threonine protein kinase/Tfp pilus assembly protein PilF